MQHLAGGRWFRAAESTIEPDAEHAGSQSGQYLYAPHDGHRLRMMPQIEEDVERAEASGDDEQCRNDVER